MTIDLNKLLNSNYIDFHQCMAREVIVYGGANSSKTWSIADKLLLQSVWQKDKTRIRIVCIRKTLPALRRSTIDVLERRAKAFGFNWDYNQMQQVAIVNNLQFIFCSLNNAEDYTKLRSMTDIDFIWINELLELREADYEECDLRLRGGESAFAQLISDFNPEDKYSWVHDRFFVRNIGHAVKFHRTIDQNHPDYLKTPKAQIERQILDRKKEYDLNRYRVFRLGEWGRLEGCIFNWDVVDKPDMAFDEIFYGGDFGYSVDPAALIKIYRKADEFWFEELLYETGLTNIQLGQRMINMGFTGDDQVVWDSAEPKSIQELCNQGLTAIGAVKGPDSVRAGIDLLKSLKCHIVTGSEHLVKEIKQYVWKKDKDGRPLNVPIEQNDHAIKAIVYALRTLYQPPSVDDYADKSNDVQLVNIYGGMMPR